MRQYMKHCYGWEGENHGVKQVFRWYFNEELCIMTDLNGNSTLIVNDAKSGCNKSWKVKIDPDCGYVYTVQKTQVKTIHSDMVKLADALVDFLPVRLADVCGFEIDYSYDIKEISNDLGVA